MDNGGSFLDDSHNELFITQTAPEYKFLEQNEEYDCLYLKSQYKNNWSIPVDQVEYWDFSNQPDNSSVIPLSPFENDYTKACEEDFQVLVSDENVSFD